MSSSEIILELESFHTLLQRLNRALAMGDTQAIFALTAEISSTVIRMEMLDVSVLTAADRDRARNLNSSIRSTQDANQLLCNSGLRTVRWCMELVQPQAVYAADGKRPQGMDVPGMNLSA